MRASSVVYKGRRDAISGTNGEMEDRRTDEPGTSFQREERRLRTRRRKNEKGSRTKKEGSWSKLVGPGGMRPRFILRTRSRRYMARTGRHLERGGSLHSAQAKDRRRVTTRMGPYGRRRARNHRLQASGAPTTWDFPHARCNWWEGSAGSRGVWCDCAQVSPTRRRW